MSNGNGVAATLSDAAESVKEKASEIGEAVAIGQCLADQAEDPAVDLLARAAKGFRNAMAQDFRRAQC